ncbi:hypothetical protein, partial [Caulobacter sp. Root342]
TWFRCQARPPLAWLKVKGCVLACIGSLSSTSGRFRKRKSPDPGKA